LQDKSEAFERQAREDALTGLQNRRSLDERLAQAFDTRCERRQPLAFALLDIDHFKRINDEYSHAAATKRCAKWRACSNARSDHDALRRAGAARNSRCCSRDVDAGAGAATLRDGARGDRARCLRLPFAPGWRMTLSGGVCEPHRLRAPRTAGAPGRSAVVRGEAAGRNRIVG
jgi:hypothetical protein